MPYAILEAKALKEVPAGLQGAVPRLAGPVLSGSYLVTVRMPVPTDAAQRLEAQGAQVHGVVPPNTFVATFPPRAFSAINAMPEVNWVGELAPALKVHPASKLLPNHETWDIRLFPGADRAPVEQEVARLGGTVRGTGAHLLRVDLPSGQLGALADLPAVMSLSPYVPPVLAEAPTDGPVLEGASIDNAWSAWVVQSARPFDYSIWNRGITGAGQIVAVGDTGLDYDHTMFFDFERNAAPPYVSLEGWSEGDPVPIVTDSEARKVISYYDWAVGTPEPITMIPAPPFDTNGHGTHVTGTASGDYGPQGVTFFGSEFVGQFGRGDFFDGLAPGAHVVVQDIGGTGNFIIGLPPDLNTLFQQAYDSGARIHTNSWGAQFFGLYTEDSRQIDEFAWNNKDFQIFFAAGNGGPGPATLDVQSVAKNAIGVGATENGFQNIENMAAFSSHGPALVSDGVFLFLTDRIKPDLATPGALVFSAEGDGDVTTFNRDLVGLGGTSMATPAAAGAAALVRQYFQDGFYPGGQLDPSSALIRAVLINSAVNMRGNHVGDDWSFIGGPFTKLDVAIPGTGQGWGRVLLDNTLYFPGETRRTLVDDHLTGLATNDFVGYEFVVGPDEPFKVSLAWTDPPSANVFPQDITVPILVNDLDLFVVDPDGNVYVGNNFRGGESQLSPVIFDGSNNLEQVLLGKPKAGVYRVFVDAFSVPQGPQPYALVVNGHLVNQDTTLSLGADLDTDPAIYNLPERAPPMLVTLTDSDLKQGAQPVIVTTSGGDVETVSLRRVAPGIFQRLLKSSSGSVVVGDGIVQVADGDEVAVEPKFGGKSPGGPTGRASVDFPAQLTDNAFIDALPPVVVATDAIGLHDVAERIDFTTDSPTTEFTLEVGLSPDALTDSFTRELTGTQGSIILDELERGTEHFYRLTTRDNAAEPNVAQTGVFSFTTRDDVLTPKRFNVGYAATFDFFGLDDDDMWTGHLGGDTRHGVARFETGVYIPEGATLTEVRVSLWLQTSFAADGDQWPLELLPDSLDSWFDTTGLLGSPTNFPPIDGATPAVILSPVPTTAGLPDSGGAMTFRITDPGDLTTFADNAYANGFVSFRTRVISLGEEDPEVDPLRDSAISWDTGFRQDAGSLGVDVRPQLAADWLPLYILGHVVSPVSPLQVVFEGTPGDSLVVSVTSATTGDSESLTLTDADGDGLLRGSIALEVASASSGDGTVQTAHGDTLTATGAGVSDTASVDAQAPAIAVSEIVTSHEKALIRWQTDEPAASFVRFEGDTFPSAGGFGTVHEVLLEGLAADTSYSATIEATDRVGNPSSLGVSFMTGNQASTATILFADDVEGPAMWTSADFSGAGDFWHVVDTADDPFHRANSPTHAWWVGALTGEGWATPPGYPNDVDNDLLSMEIDLVDFTDLTLRFSISGDSEPGFDFLTVVILDVTEAEWRSFPVFRISGTNPDYPDFTTYELALGDAFFGRNIRIVFNFFSDVAFSDADGLYDGDGWFVDDIELTGFETQGN